MSAEYIILADHWVFSPTHIKVNWSVPASALSTVADLTLVTLSHARETVRPWALWCKIHNSWPFKVTFTNSPWWKTVYLRALQCKIQWGWRFKEILTYSKWCETVRLSTINKVRWGWLVKGTFTKYIIFGHRSPEFTLPSELKKRFDRLGWLESSHLN